MRWYCITTDLWDQEFIEYCKLCFYCTLGYTPKVAEQKVGRYIVLEFESVAIHNPDEVWLHHSLDCIVYYTICTMSMCDNEIVSCDGWIVSLGDFRCNQWVTDNHIGTRIDPQIIRGASKRMHHLPEARYKSKHVFFLSMQINNTNTNYEEYYNKPPLSRLYFILVISQKTKIWTVISSYSANFFWNML